MDDASTHHNGNMGYASVIYKFTWAGVLICPCAIKTDCQDLTRANKSPKPHLDFRWLLWPRNSAAGVRRYVDWECTYISTKYMKLLKYSFVAKWSKMCFKTRILIDCHLFGAKPLSDQWWISANEILSLHWKLWQYVEHKKSWNILVLNTGVVNGHRITKI